MIFNKELKVSIGVYLILVTFTLYILQKNPKFVTFSKKFKDFGLGKDKTVLPAWMYFIYSAIIVYIFTIIFIL